MTMINNQECSIMIYTQKEKVTLADGKKQNPPAEGQSRRIQYRAPPNPVRFPPLAGSSFRRLRRYGVSRHYAQHLSAHQLGRHTPILHTVGTCPWTVAGTRYYTQ